MRKLKSDKEAKKKQKIEEMNEENRVVDYSEQLPFTTIDYVIYAIFFAVTLFNKNIPGVIVVLGVLFLGLLLYKYITKKISNNFLYRLGVFLLLSIIALPVRLIMLKFM